MRRLLIVLPLLLAPMAQSQAEVSIAIGMPGLNIGINIPLYPDLVPVPGYPVYYDPNAPTNYFFYDGLYWVFQGDSWYQSSWYNGPWVAVAPVYVPAYILRVPVRYYRYPPPYFRGWGYNAPPRWGEYWGPSWEARRNGWDRWNHNAVPARAPLPVYQRQYNGNNYPRNVEEQRNLGAQHYRYQPHDAYARQNMQAPRGPEPERNQPPPPQQRPPSPPQGNQGRPPEPQQPGRPPAPPRPQQMAPNAPWQHPHGQPPAPPPGQPPQGQPWQQPGGRPQGGPPQGQPQGQPWQQQGGHQHGGEQRPPDNGQQPHQQERQGEPGRGGEGHQRPPYQQEDR